MKLHEMGNPDYQKYCRLPVLKCSILKCDAEAMVSICVYICYVLYNYRYLNVL